MDGTMRGDELRAARSGRARQFVWAFWLAVAAASPTFAQDPTFAQEEGPTGQPEPVVTGETAIGDAVPPERVGPHPLASGETDPAAGEEPAPPAPADPPAGGATTPEPPANGGTENAPQLPTAEQIAAKLAQIKAAGETDPPTDNLTAEQRAAAIAELTAAAEARKRLNAFTEERAAAEAAAEAVETQAKKLQEELDAVPAVPSKEELQEDIAEMTDAAVMTDRTKAEIDRTRLVEARDNLSAAGERRAADKTALRAALKRATEVAAAAESVDPDLPTDVTFSRLVRLRLEKAAAAEALAAAEAEGIRATAAAAVGLPALRRNLVDKKIALVTAKSAAAKDELDRRASEKARELAAEAEDLSDLTPAIRPLAREVAALREDYQRQLAKRMSAEKQTEKTAVALARVQARWDRIDFRVQRLGLSDALSASLRRERPDLPALDQIEAGIAAREEEIESAFLLNANHRDAVAALPPADKHAERAHSLLVREGPEDLVGDEFAAEVEKAQKLYDDRRKLLYDLAPGEDATGLDQEVIDRLVDLQSAQTEFRDTVAAFADYIDERVLWVRSGAPLNKDQLEEEIPTIAGWAAPDAVRKMVGSTLEAVLSGLGSPATGFALLGCIALIVFRTRMRGLLTRWAGPSRRKGSLTFQPTAAALATTLLGAAAGPALLTWFSYVLTNGWGAPSMEVGRGSLPSALTAAALGAAAGYTALVWFPLALLRAATRRDGLAEAHYQWPNGGVRRVQRQARWFAPPLLSAAAIAGLLGSSDPLHSGGGWERVAFATACVLTAWMLYRLFHPAGVVWESVHKVAPESPSYKLRVPLCVLAVLGAAAVGGLSVFGYHYTAGELARRALFTAGLLVVVVLMRSAAVRWVTVSRRAMLYRGMQRRREEAVAREQASAEGATPTGQPTEPVAAPAEEPTVTAEELSGQTRTLVTAAALTLGAVGLWFVWADVLPALNKLEDVTFPSWTVRREIPAIDLPGASEVSAPAANEGGNEGGENGGAAADLPKPRFERVPISLWDLLVAAAATGLTVLAARNLPGLLALSVFDRLPLDAGGRYAVSRLAGYAAVVIGVLFIAGRVGFEWESVQWLVAALTVGLGFGLQEIVANFVCGAIILFERPVRVGDVVTVGDVTGAVSRIRIRATTITNWDRKEFIVPNKEFVTGRLLNWTLSDSTNRIVIEVGVAYGSDTQRARDLLIEAATEAPLVLTDPGPIATFEGFGDSTLNLILRCYLPNLDQRLPVISELHAAIDRKFRDAGIEIAFPQRDLHVRTVPAALTAIGERPASRQAENAQANDEALSESEPRDDRVAA